MRNKTYNRNEEYFQFSQKVKREIQGNPELVSRLVAYLSEGVSLDVISEAGGKHDVYRVGQLESGLWVALRENKSMKYLLTEHPGEFVHLAMYIYENYCVEAESLSAKGKMVPRFSIGGYIDKIPFLLVEDMTEGGMHETYSQYAGRGESASKDSRKRNGKEEEVYFDFGFEGTIDVDCETTRELTSGRFDVSSFRYFNPEARLNLSLL